MKQGTTAGAYGGAGANREFWNWLVLSVNIKLRTGNDLLTQTTLPPETQARPPRPSRPPSRVRTRPAARRRRATARAGTLGEGCRRRDREGPAGELASEVVMGEGPMIRNSQLQPVKWGKGKENWTYEGNSDFLYCYSGSLYTNHRSGRRRLHN
jgi:hypothetical protein